jgi:hypothetical protein
MASTIKFTGGTCMPPARPNSLAMAEKTAALLDPPVGPEAATGPGVVDGGQVDRVRKG